MGSLVCWVYNAAYCIWCCNSVGLCLLIVLSLFMSLFSVCWLFLSLISSPKMFTWQSPPHFLHSSPSLYYRTCVLARTQMHAHHAPVPSQRVNSGVPQASWTVLLHNAGISVCERICIYWQNGKTVIVVSKCLFWSTEKLCGTELYERRRSLVIETVDP